MIAKMFVILAIIGIASASSYGGLGYSSLGYRGLGYSNLGYSGLGYGTGLGYSARLGYNNIGYGGIAAHGLTAPAVATSYSNSYTAPTIRTYGYGAGYGAHGARLGW